MSEINFSAVSQAPLRQFTIYLSKKNVLDEKQLHDAIFQCHSSKQNILHYLAAEKIIASDQLTQLLSEFFKIPVIDLSHFNIQQTALNKISKKIMETHLILPLEKNNNHLKIAVFDPTETKIFETIQFQTNYPIEIVLARQDQLKKIIQPIISAHDEQLLHQTQIPSEITEPIEHSQTEEPVVRFVNSMIKDALHQKASDIHFEVYENHCRIRFRQDGLLHETAKPPRHLASQLISRLKIMAKLNIAEKRLPQDGHFKIKIQTLQNLDIRISACPTIHGEKIVLRLLNYDRTFREIKDLNFSEQQFSHVLKSLRQTQGLILVTGPTGSGKTVTLYAALQHLNTIEKNILTIEDPVEINLSGINQLNINSKIGLSFPIALRAFLRQDPDIIMIGEIRDTETAKIAVKAAQTGHLVLSTLHTNNTIESFNRLQQLGISIYDLLDSIILITAQRLVRQSCPHCKMIESIHCEHCMNGYQGRMAIHEVLPLNKNFIFQKNLKTSLKQYFQENQLLTLKQSALQAVKNNLTTIEEIYRVIGDE